MPVDLLEQQSTGPRDLLEPSQPRDLLTGKDAPQTGLFSVEGVRSIGQSILPNVRQWYHGSRLADFDAFNISYQQRLARGEVPTPELTAQYEESGRLADEERQKLQALNEENRRNRPANPSYPLEIATGAVNSVAGMAPGIGVGVGVARVLGSRVGMAPALMMAEQQQFGRAYAEHRVPEDVKKQAAPIEEALLNAKISAYLEAGFEMLPTSKLLEEVGKVGLGRLIRNYLVREWATEIPTTITQDITEWATVEKDKPIGDFLRELRSNVIDTAVTTPFVAGMGASLAKAQSAAGLYISPNQPTQMGPSGEMTPVDLLSVPSTGDLQHNIPPTKTSVPPPSLLAQIDTAFKTQPIPTDAEAEAARQRVAAYEAERKATPPNPATVTTLADLDGLNAREDFGEIGAGPEPTRNADNYPNENDLQLRTERPVLFAPAGIKTGLSLKQTEIVPGVYAVGVPTRDRDEETIKAAVDTLAPWVAKYLPGKTVLLMNEGLATGSAVGWHARLDSGVHVITPAPIRWDKTKHEFFNRWTQFNFFSNLTHEFGHALIHDRFFDAVDTKMANAIRIQSNMGLIDNQLIEQVAAVDPLKADVLREFNAIKSEVLSGQMTALEFQQRWMNAGKNSMYSFTKRQHSTPGTAKALQLVDAIIRRAYRSNKKLDSIGLAKLRNEYLGIDEFLAEQVARYAYAQKWDEQAPKSMTERFGAAIRSVRDELMKFFKDIKQELGAGVKFTDWMTGLTKDTQADAPIPKPRRRKTKLEKEMEQTVTDTALSEISELAELREQARLNNIEIDAALTGISELAALRYALAEKGVKPKKTRKPTKKAESSIPPVAEGKVRFYHGGAPYTDGPRWLTQDLAYAQGYAEKSGGSVYYVDIAEKSPLLKKSFEDEGTSFKSPYVSFEAPERVAKRLKPFKTDAAVEPVTPPLDKSKPVEELDHNVETASVDRQKNARAAVNSLVKDGTIERGSEKYTELMALIKAHDFDTFTDEMQPYLEKKVRFELESDEELFDRREEELKKLDADIVKARGAYNRALLRKQGVEDAVLPEVDENRLYPDFGGLYYTALDWARYLEDALWMQAAWKTGDINNEYINPIAFSKYAETNNPESAGQAYDWAIAQKWGLEDDYHEKYFYSKLPKINFELGDPAFDIDLADWTTEITLPLTKEVKADIEQHVDTVHAAAGILNIPYWERGEKTQLTEAEAMNPSTLADAANEWLKKGFESKYFKAWFGDWSGDPVRASQVVNAVGEPLKLYHATSRDFDVFRIGDIGFHFGTLRAAHNRVYGYTAYTELDEIHKDLLLSPVANLSGSREKIQFLPVVLNIRNPLYIGSEDSGTLWHSAKSAAYWLHGRGFISQQEYEEVSLQIGAQQGQVSKTQSFEPIRALLMEKGYDGIKYENTIEGDTSWVAFRPEQIKSVLGSRTFSRSPKIHFELDFDEAQPAGYGASRFWKQFKGMIPNPKPFKRALRWAARKKYDIIQAQQLAHLEPAASIDTAATVGNDVNLFSETINTFERYKGALQGTPSVVADRWAKESKEGHALVNKFLLAEMDSGQHWFDLVRDPTWHYEPNQTTYDKMKEVGIPVDTEQGQNLAQLILDIKSSYLEHLNQAERVLQELYARKYGANPGELMDRLGILANTIHAIRTKPFIHQGRFGPYVYTIEVRSQSGRGWTIAHRQAFEDFEERAAEVAKVKARLKPNERLRVFDKSLTDSEYVLLTLPQDFLEDVVAALGLGPETRNKLYDMLIPAKAEKLLKAYDRERLGITGGSTDLQRSFSEFMWHNSNLLSKARYRADFNLAIRGVEARVRQEEYADGPNRMQYQRIRDFMKRTRDTIMSPPQEAYAMRSTVALLYLMYNVKTAAMNATGMMTTWADVSTELGPVRAEALLARATKAAWQSIRFRDLNVRKEGNYLTPEWQWALDRALEEGQLTQSYAYHLAGMANSSNLHRLPATDKLSRGLRGAIDLGMWTFRLTELGSRRVTFLAEYQVARDKGMSQGDAYAEAIRKTNLLQNDFSIGNRPHWLGAGTAMGKTLPVITVFYSYLQHMAFHTFGGYEIGMRRADRLAGRAPKAWYNSYTLRLWLVLLALAGYEGLPGFENILDILDFVWKRLFGKPARQDIREGIRDFVKAATGVSTDPLSFAHGLGHNIGGFDVSRSIGLGRIVPGTDVMAKSTTGNPMVEAANLAFGLAGPAGGVAEWILKTAADPEKGMKRAPGALGNVFNAWTWHNEGVLDPGRSRITRDAVTGELRDLTTPEIFGKVLGFSPEIVSRSRQIMFQQHDARMYWTTRRSELLKDYFTAWDKQDREAMADVQDAVEKFNNSLPEGYEQLRLRPKDISASRKDRTRRKRLTEQGLPPTKRYRGVYRDVRESFSSEPGEP